MDFLKRITAFLGKYRYAALVLVIGLILMLLPAKNDRTAEPQQTQAQEEKSEDISQELTEILSLIQGVGKVKVMLTLEEGETVIYQADESNTSTDTVIIADEDRNQTGLVQQVKPPKYRGAIIVCQGADSASVRLGVIEAVARVTGLSTDRISVLKMK